MAAGKYIAYDATGKRVEEQGIATSTGAADADKLIRLDAAGRLDSTVMPVGIGADTKLLPATEALAAGDFVNIYDNAGTTSTRKADASAAASGKKAHGFVLVAVTSGNPATIYFEGTNSQLTGLSGGEDYFLSATTPGAVVNTPPTTAGHILQKLGVATGATEINIEIAEPVIRA